MGLVWETVSLDGGVYFVNSRLNTLFRLSHGTPQMLPRRNIKAPRYTCDKCSRRFYAPAGLTQHKNSLHRSDARPRGTAGSSRIERHPFLTGEFVACYLDSSIYVTIARPCDAEGNFLPEGTLPAQAESRTPGDWAPFNSRDEFELADLLFTRTEMSHTQINELMQIWGARSALEGGTTPFTDSKDLHSTIDAIEEGDAPWYSFKVGYDGDRPLGKVPSWMDDSHQVFYRDPRQVVRVLLGNHKFNGDFDYVPYREYEDGERKWGDFMSGSFCWKQAVRLTTFFDSHSSHSMDRI